MDRPASLLGGRRRALTATLALACALPAFGQTTEADPLYRLRRVHHTAEEAGEIVVRGKDGWLFYRPELRFLSVGPFWGEHAAKVSRSRKPENADPLAAIVDFDRQLERVGVELVVVPVPPKALVYPEHLPGQADVETERDALAWTPFLDRLRASDVTVVDLVPVFLEQRAWTAENPPTPDDPWDDDYWPAADELLYCKTDTHWSPYGLDVAAREIAKVPVVKRLAQGDPETVGRLHGSSRIEIVGDLTQLARDETLPMEGLELVTPSRTKPAFDRESPLLLIGDSHVLVFSAGGDMHAEHAGLGENLAARLGRPLDRIGVRGSGALAPRVDLMRRKDDLAGKQVVIWVFAARDLTEAESGWPKVPVVREPK